MSSRVEQENQARQAAEAERLQKRIEKDGREQRTSEANREAFAKLVSRDRTAADQGARDAKAKGERTEAEAKQGDAQAGKAGKQAGDAERAARMARGGVLQQSRVMEQARSFQGVLQNHQGTTQQADTGRVERREQGKNKDRVERDDREVGIQRQEQKRDVEAELARVEAREQGRPNAAIDANGKGDKGDGRGNEGAQALAKSKAPASAQGAQAAREVKQIPPELLEKLVSAVYLAVNDKGLKEFQIELKDGPLKGALLKITAEDGKVGLRFEGLGAGEKRLVEASKGELLRRLEKKGLALARLDVV
jgi:hypothetical protein